MNDDFQPIPAFKGQLPLADAYNWQPVEIIKFLDGVVKDPAKYGAPHDTASKATFKLLYDEISALASPNGEKYKDPQPPQQLLRKKGEPPALEPTGNVSWSGSETKEKYFIIFDLLGAFLSLMGPFPTDTGTVPTATNFFLPLAVVYGRWCGKLAPENRPRAQFTPTVAQVTWSRKGDNKPWYFFLGGSSRGWYISDGKRPKPDKRWADLVKQTRHGYLHRILEAQQDNPRYRSYGESPSLDMDSKAGTNFGNCGETYPFLYVVEDQELKKNCYGIAINIAGIEDEKSSTPNYAGKVYWEKPDVYFKPPCINCEHLLKWYGVGNRVDCFKPWGTKLA